MTHRNATATGELPALASLSWPAQATEPGGRHRADRPGARPAADLVDPTAAVRRAGARGQGRTAADLIDRLTGATR